MLKGQTVVCPYNWCTLADENCYEQEYWRSQHKSQNFLKKHPLSFFCHTSLLNSNQEIIHKSILTSNC
ncbi:MAG: hypothetical protein SAL70_14895 [Scytonema sp. PMC 1070.18]|nr:hypothetical protein [Scytonema sp. PMC 1070.18]